MICLRIDVARRDQDLVQESWSDRVYLIVKEKKKKHEKVKHE